MKNFAHRGFSGKYPENTMLAFTKAYEVGADGIELDVQYTKDGQLVIIHDEKVDRTTDGQGLVRDYLLEDLLKLDASSTYRGTIEQVRIPTFKEYCDWVKDKDLITNIELKNGVYPYPGIEELVLNEITAHNLEDKVIISSFNHFSILRMKALAKHLKYGLLSESWLIDAGKYVHDLGIDCYHPYFPNLTEEVVAEIKQYNIEINTFTVNEGKDVIDLQHKGIDCVIGNFPDMVKNLLTKETTN